MSKLRYYLDEHGIGMAWVAKQVGINYDRFYRLCAGTAKPPPRQGVKSAPRGDGFCDPAAGRFNGPR